MAHVEHKDATAGSGAQAAGESLLARAAELEQGGELAEAERLLEQALEAGELPAGSRAAAMEAVGRVKLRLGDAGGACRWLEQALRAHERRRQQSREPVAWLHLVLAAAWRRAGEERRAEALAAGGAAAADRAPGAAAGSCRGAAALPDPVPGQRGGAISTPAVAGVACPQNARASSAMASTITHARVTGLPSRTLVHPCVAASSASAGERPTADLPPDPWRHPRPR
jgi:tetratricopeptide (TPR) repeat protein